MDLVHAQVRVRAVGQAHRRRAARDFLHGDAVRQIAEPCPAVFLRHGDAEHAEFAELRPQVARECRCCGRSASARGAICSSEKRVTLSRNASTSSPSAKSNPAPGHSAIIGTSHGFCAWRRAWRDHSTIRYRMFDIRQRMASSPRCRAAPPANEEGRPPRCGRVDRGGLSMRSPNGGIDAVRVRAAGQERSASPRAASTGTSPTAAR